MRGKKRIIHAHRVDEDLESVGEGERKKLGKEGVERPQWIP